MSTTIPGYGQEKPTEESAIQSLSETMGSKPPAVSAWSSAVQGAGLDRPVEPIDDLEKVADKLTASENNLARVGGRSLKIRLTTYKLLSRKAGA